MRLLARLKLNLQKLQKSKNEEETGPTTLDEFLAPEYFDMVIQAAIMCSAYDDVNDQESEDMEAPSNALKLQHMIRDACNAKLGLYIREKDTDKQKEATDFLRLMKFEWSTHAQRLTLDIRRHLNRKPLPLPQDIVKMVDFVKKQGENFEYDDHSYSNYRWACQLAITRICFYNRARTGTIQAIW